MQPCTTRLSQMEGNSSSSKVWFWKFNLSPLLKWKTPFSFSCNMKYKPASLYSTSYSSAKYSEACSNVCTAVSNSPRNCRMSTQNNQVSSWKSPYSTAFL